MRLPARDEHTPRLWHANGTTRSFPRVSQCTRTKPETARPQVTKSCSVRATKPGTAWRCHQQRLVLAALADTAAAKQLYLVLLEVQKKRTRAMEDRTSRLNRLAIDFEARLPG